jgi:2Fe-2S ferredoxin
MIKITFIDPTGTAHAVEAPEGMSLMQAAVNHNVPGIDADCSGSMTCGTCRVAVPEESASLTGARSPLEQQMLEFSGLDEHGIRLSCQLIARQEFDGMCVRIPASHL